MTNLSDRFNKLILDLGYRRQVYHMNGGVKMTIIFDDDNKPITPQALSQRFKQWLKNNNITSDVQFKLTIKLPTYQVVLA